MSEQLKRCNGDCKQMKPVSEFHKNSGRKDGLSNRCITCTKEYQKKYYKKNKVKIDEKNLKHYYDNKEHRSEMMANWYQENKEQVKQHQKEYYKNNKYIAIAKDNKRRAQKLNATLKGVDYYSEEIKLFYKKAKELELEDGIKRNVDHIVPLQGKNVCGLHVPWNLQILTEEENKKKNNKF